MNMTWMQGRESQMEGNARAQTPRNDHEPCFAPDLGSRRPVQSDASSWTGSGDDPGPTASEIAAEDWDLLFRAALALLVRVVIERPEPAHPHPGRQLQAPGTVLRECLAALDQLRRERPSDPLRQRPCPPGAAGA
ncbi:hypothetical protein [Ideonella sp. B508-1]|uniref:hypothetical protein n=1 Tax=Ideonella sp. B508-1 TaxID=137716 RepID=UPI0011D1E05F|nr:hypothetical protein [Ideonella sp. B508-1]